MDFTNKKIIIFDLDGTITDSSEGIINSFKYALKANGISDYSNINFYKYLGPPLVESFMDAMETDRASALKAIDIYREYYEKTGIFENRLYDGIDSLIERLVNDGRKIILATSKAEVFAKIILDYFNISQYFLVIAGSELDGTRVKKGEVISYALEKAGIRDLKDVVMIGDRKHDILGAKEVGIDSIGVLYGYGDLKEIDGSEPSFIAETMEDLSKCLIR